MMMLYSSPLGLIPWFKVLEQFNYLKSKVFTGDNDGLSVYNHKKDMKHRVIQIDMTSIQR